MDAVEIGFEVEEELRVIIPTDELGELRTVGDVVAGLQRVVAKSEAEQRQAGSCNEARHSECLAAMPEIGKAAPAFALANQDDEEVQLSDFEGRWVVLWFYPKDDTPG